MKIWLSGVEELRRHARYYVHHEREFPNWPPNREVPRSLYAEFVDKLIEVWPGQVKDVRVECFETHKGAMEELSRWAEILTQAAVGGSEDETDRYANGWEVGQRRRERRGTIL